MTFSHSWLGLLVVSYKPFYPGISELWNSLPSLPSVCKMAEFINRHTSLYCTSKILWFPQIEGLWQPYMANKVFLRATLCKEQQSISKFKKFFFFLCNVTAQFTV